jgi:S-formylglutathione hydrolase FrmB
MVDRMLPTIPARSARGVAGNSMGGFGAMHAALANPFRFSVVESWLGYFNHLDGELRADRPVIKQLGLHAFLYGATGDAVADPAEDPYFAAKLRAAGARAKSAIYVGNHSLQTVREHLKTMLLFAGRAFAQGQSGAPR